MVLNFFLLPALIRFDESRDNSGPSTDTAWYMWPSGTWSYTYQDGRLMKDVTINFASHWVWNPLKTTNTTDNHTLVRKCQGVLVCMKPGCPGIARPAAKSPALSRQLLEERCQFQGCGSMFRQISCEAACYVRTKIDGTGRITFAHRGDHAHLCPPTIHLNPIKAVTLRKTIESNPHQTAIQLITGSTLDGQSLIELDHSLANSDRVAYYRRQVLSDSAQPARGGDKFVDSLSDFMRKNPDFVVHHEFSPLILIVMQSKYMAACMIEDILCQEDRHGFVTDANHSYFISDRKYLLVTTTFSTLLKRWVPVFLAYSGGQSEDDYRAYFLHFFERIRSHMGSKSAIMDEHVAQVSYNLSFQCFFILRLMCLLGPQAADYSQAQRGGFIEGFADWQLNLLGVPKERVNDPSHSTDRINFMHRAEKLLKGCRVHFLRSVKTVAQSASLVDPSAKSRFRELADELCSAPSLKEFQSVESAIRKEFPTIKNWLDWWVRPSIASQIFQAHKIMNPELDAMLPDTTNPVESLHNILGVSVGKGHQFIVGLIGLSKWTTRYELESEAVKSTSLLSCIPCIKLSQGNSY